MHFFAWEQLKTWVNMQHVVKYIMCKYYVSNLLFWGLPVIRTNSIVLYYEYWTLLDTVWSFPSTNINRSVDRKCHMQIIWYEFPIAAHRAADARLYCCCWPNFVWEIQIKKEKKKQKNIFHYITDAVLPGLNNTLNTDLNFAFSFNIWVYLLCVMMYPSIKYTSSGVCLL